MIVGCTYIICLIKFSIQSFDKESDSLGAVGLATMQEKEFQ